MLIRKSLTRKKAILNFNPPIQNQFRNIIFISLLHRFENGRYNTLEYDYNKKITDFKDELALPPGNYMLVTGNRLNDSKILSNITFFELSENEHKTLDSKNKEEISPEIRYLAR